VRGPILRYEQMFTAPRSIMGLTPRQQQILEVIRAAVATQGYPPTVREIGTAVGLSSPASVQNHLSVLEAKGFIRRGVSRRRALELMECATTLPGARGNGHGGGARVPLVGRVAAGTPLLAEENVEDMLEIPGFLAEDDGCFALEVRGTSMIGAGILDGDVVVVRRQDDAQNGDIVVALLEDEATVKRFFREADHVRLQPENDEMAPILAREPRILGKVTGVMRRL
jgi:repressor LexA